MSKCSRVTVLTEGNPFAWAAAMVYCMVLDIIYIKRYES